MEEKINAMPNFKEGKADGFKVKLGLRHAKRKLRHEQNHNGVALKELRVYNVTPLIFGQIKDEREMELDHLTQSFITNREELRMHRMLCSRLIFLRKANIHIAAWHLPCINRKVIARHGRWFI